MAFGAGSWWRRGSELWKAGPGPGRQIVDQAKPRMLDHLAVSREGRFLLLTVPEARKASLSH